eukprot:12643678-Ditylum_brightwellii.AAC.1
MYGIYARQWEGNKYYHIYTASAAQKTSMVNTSNTKEVDATFIHMKLQCMFVTYPPNRTGGKKVIVIQQQKVESSL